MPVMIRLRNGTILEVLEERPGALELSVEVDGESVGAVSSYTFMAVAANHTIAASFEADFFTLTASAGAHGTLTPAGETVLASGANQIFTLADGTHQGYDIGEACFDLGVERATSRVVFAPEGVTPLIGAMTLEALGLMVNPVTRELLPMRLFLATLGARVQRIAEHQPS